MGFDLEKERKLTILPSVYFKPETRWAFGVSALTYRRLSKKDTVSPLSVAGLSFNYTLNDQILFQMPFRIFLKQDNYRLIGELSYYRYPYFFAGIGNGHPEDYSEDYTAKFPRVDFTLLKRLNKLLFTGPKFFYQNTEITETEEGGLLRNSLIPGSVGSVTTGLGWEVVLDKRDFIYAPTKGYYVNVSYVGFTKFLGGNFEYNQFVFDARKYFNLGKDHILGFQAYNSSIFGIAPFNKLSQLGGDKIMRGYKKGVLRDDQYLATQVEYRTPIWHFFGFTAFLGGGLVSKNLKDYQIKNIQPSYGGGLRLAFNKKERIHIRVDYARGLNRQEFYITFAEAF